MGWVLADGTPLAEGRLSNQELHELAQWQLANTRARVPFTTKAAAAVAALATTGQQRTSPTSSEAA